MGIVIDPAKVTESGEFCLNRLTELSQLGLPPGQLVVSICTAVEMHVARVLARMVVVSGVQEQHLGDYMVKRLEDDMTRSWASRKKWLGEGFAVVPRYQEFDVLVELRNAVVHGDEALSPVQERKPIAKLIELRKQLRQRLNVELYGRASFAPDSASRAVDIARAFVADLDGLVLDRHPEARRL